MQGIDELLELTHDADPKVRSRAVRELCPCHVQADIERIWQRIFAMVDDGDVGVRRTVVHAFIDGSPRAIEPRVVDALEGMRNDPNPALRRNVRKLLARYRKTGKVNI